MLNSTDRISYESFNLIINGVELMRVGKLTAFNMHETYILHFSKNYMQHINYMLHIIWTILYGTTTRKY